MKAPAVLKTMSGEGVLQIVRETLANESARIRACQERYVADGLQNRIDPGRLAVILALNAGADIVTSIIAKGKDARGQKDGLPRNVKLEIVRDLANSARVALLAEWGDTAEDDAPAGEDDNAAAE